MYSIQISSYLVCLLSNRNSCQLCWFFVVIHTSCSCLLFVSCWCLIIALHSTKVGDLGALSDGIWTLTVLSLIVTTRSDCPSGIPWFVAVEAAGVADNEKAYGELKFVVFSCLLWNFILCFLPELLGFVIGPFADKGGVGVDFEVVPVFPDPYLQKNKVSCYTDLFFLDQPQPCICSIGIKSDNNEPHIVYGYLLLIFTQHPLL